MLPLCCQQLNLETVHIEEIFDMHRLRVCVCVCVCVYAKLLTYCICISALVWPYQGTDVLFKSLHAVAESVCYLRHIRPSVCTCQRGSHLTIFFEIWYVEQPLWKSVQKIQIFLKSGKNIERLIWISKYIVLFLTTLNGCKFAVVEWNGIRLWE